jgi:C1A family cysteine protease
MWPFGKKRIPNFYGWKPDLPDHRDFVYAEKFEVKQSTANTIVDLRKLCSPIEDQGNLGSCTANALVGNLEFLELKAGQRLIDLSRLFVYYNERVIEHDVSQDNGAMLRDGIKALASKGVCPEKNWPYIISKFAKKPCATCYIQGLMHRITSYIRLNTLTDMTHCLDSGFPFVFGFTVYDYFESAEMEKTGILKMPTANESVLGGHAVCAVGYDPAKKLFLVRNSWGTSWGQQGYFWMPFDYMTNRDLSDDFWTIRK